MRPARSVVESVTEQTPSGPLGFIGGGNAIGATGYFTVSAINGIVPVDGLEVGYEVDAKDIDRGEEVDIITYRIYSASRDVARFVGKYQSSPTNINFLREKPEVTSVEKLEDDIFFPLWKVTVEREKAA